jgi:hypothetical protein
VWGGQGPYKDCRATDYDDDDDDNINSSKVNKITSWITIEAQDKSRPAIGKESIAICIRGTSRKRELYRL